MQTEKNPRSKWREMSPVRRTGLVLMGLIQFSLLAAALWDLRRRPPEMVRGDKRLWVGLSFINYVGPISYFVVGRKR
jgi:hypothetical protein